jgi:hypothetical protein
MVLKMFTKDVILLLEGSAFFILLGLLTLYLIKAESNLDKKKSKNNTR